MVAYVWFNVKEGIVNTIDLDLEVRKIIANKLGKKIEQIVNEASLVNDLGADSLENAELQMTLENELGVRIQDEDLNKLTTVQEIIDYIKKRLPATIN